MMTDITRFADLVLRSHPRATVVLRTGWRWAAVAGPVEIAGPDESLEGVGAERLRLLLREIFTAAGGTHDDFDAYDKAMAAERRAAILVLPARIYHSRSRPPGRGHMTSGGRGI
jgi:hypothetical protein